MAFSGSRAFIWHLNKNKNIFTTKSGVPNGLSSITNCQVFNKCALNTNAHLVGEDEAVAVGLHKKKLSKSMKVYIERSKEHNEFMNKARAEYKIGKRHLANMMGESPDDFSENDVKKAIEYLFPSGIHDPAARPVMKPPDEIFPARKAAEFDQSGRPFNSMFYTCRPNYYQTLHRIVEQMHILDEKEEKLYSAGSEPNEVLKLNLDSSVWLTKVQLETLLIENLTDPLYEYFINTMERMLSHPVSYEAKDFILKYRKNLKNIFDSVQLLPVEYDTDGRPFVKVSDCMRKSSRGQVILRGKGSGKITINGEDISYFKGWQYKEQMEDDRKCLPLFKKIIPASVRWKNLLFVSLVTDDLLIFDTFTRS